MSSMTLHTTALVGLAALLPLGACKEPTNDEPEGTGVRVTISLDPTLGIDRLEISGSDLDGTEAFAKGQVPETPRTLASSEIAIVLLADTLAGSPLLIRVDGLLGAQIVATERATVTPVLGEIVDVALTLGAPAVCGDGAIRAGFETCDDANTDPDDGCSTSCAIESGYSCIGTPSSCGIRCGDSILGAGEGCDDGDTQGGDGCSVDCQLENGFVCGTDLPSVCAPECGDSIVIAPETCDDDNTDNGDGCSGGCLIENGWSCNTATPTQCKRCGNEFVEVGEDCDDGNFDPGDGCDAQCEGEVGFICVGTPSVCTATTGCGNGIVEGSEGCDDNNANANDGCDGSCAVEGGWTCNNTVAPSACRRCGDNLVQVGEGCDDGNDDASDGCSNLCQVEAGWSCTNTTVGSTQSICEDCGNGTVEGTETCDDGDEPPAGGDGCNSSCRIEGTFTCDTTQVPTVCLECGDGIAQPGQTCDGADTGGATCLSLGYRIGGGSTGVPTCASNCLGFDTSGCGPPINSQANLEGGIQDAFDLVPDGHYTVAIQAGSFDVTSTVVVNEGGGNQGITLTAVGGQGIIRSTSSTEPALRLTSPNHLITGLTLTARRAIRLENGASNTAIRANYFQHGTISYAPVIVVESLANNAQIVANAFHNNTSSVGRNAILINGASGNTVAMNVIDGDWGGGASTDAAIGLNNLSGSFTFVDHNSVRLRGAVAGLFGLAAITVSDLCYRNNIISGTASSTGIFLSAFSLGTSCTGGQSTNNANVGHALACQKSGSGNPCNVVCGTGMNNAMCSITTTPNFTDAWLCLPTGNGLHDVGLDLGYDTNDSGLANYNDVAPDVGAREGGASRVFGGTTSTCP